MSVEVKLELKVWQPNNRELRLTANELRNNFLKLKEDDQVLQTMMIDNINCCLVIDGEEITRCTFMFDGESSPDMMYYFENHLLEIWERRPATIHFFEEMTAWRFIPDEQHENEMVWEILDESRGQSSAKVEQSGRCERLSFISSSLAWLENALEIMKLYKMKLYKDPVRKSGHNDLTEHVAFAQRLYDFSRQAMVSRGWQPE
jgi:hypothetical protein